MSACILKTNPDYQNLLNNSNFTESTLNFIVSIYWKEHPEKGIEGKEQYPSLEYVNSFFDTATSSTTAGNVIKLWRAKARNTFNFSSLEEATQKKEELAETFDDEAILVWNTKDGQYHVKVARPLLEDESRGFSFNREQKNAIAKISDWFMDKREGKVSDNWVVLEGEAGTGKTSIISDILLNTVSMFGSKVVTGAVSNQATDNIIDKISEQVSKIFEISRKTVAGMLGLKMDTSTEKKGFIEDAYSRKEIFDADIVIIDEASMVTEQLTDYVKQAAQMGIPVLFIGDAAQINPIREGEYFNQRPEIQKDAPSPVFDRKNQTLVLSLKERVRQGEDSPILDFAHKYRQSWETGTPIPNVRGENSSADGRLVYTARPASQLLQDLIPVFQEAIRLNNPNLIHIVPFHRDYQRDSYGNIISIAPRSALWWNQKIYDALHPEQAGTYVFQKGDLVRFDDDYTVSDTESIHNSTNAQVVKVSEEHTDINGVRYRNVTLNIQGLREITVPVVAQDMNGYKTFEAVKRKLFAEARKMAPGKERVKKYQSIHAYIDSYANVTFSYALNVHRAQGSTYDITILDQDDIDSVKRFYNPKQLASLGYTAATRAKNVLVVASHEASDPNMSVDLLATNKRFNEARSNRPVTVATGGASTASVQLNGARVIPGAQKDDTTIDVVFANEKVRKLSNFGETPFIPNTPVFNYNTRTQELLGYPGGMDILSGGMTFRTLEGAFQALKLAYTKEYNRQQRQSLIEDLAKADGKTARALGRAIRGLDTKAWDKESSEIMYKLLKEKFLQNGDVKDMLLATKGKTLVHSIPDSGNSDFIGNLIKLRDELIREQEEELVATMPSALADAVRISMKTVERRLTRKARAANMDSSGTFTIPSTGTFTADEILTRIVNGTLDNNATDSEKKLAASLIPLVQRLGLKIRFINEEKHYSGQSYGTRKAGIDIDIISINPKLQAFPAHTIIHEITHTLTTTLLKNDKDFRDAIDNLRNHVIQYVKDNAFGGELKTKTYFLYDEDKKRYAQHNLNFDVYGLSTNGEFLAEAMGNEAFQNMLRQIPSIKNKKIKVWEKFVKLVTDAFSRLFKTYKHTRKSVYDDLMPVLSYAMEVGSQTINRDKGTSEKVEKAKLSDEAIKEAGQVLQTRSPEAFAGVAESQQTIESEKTILSNEELKYWNKQGVGEAPRILVASEHTDPAFHVKQILDVINGNSTVTQFIEVDKSVYETLPDNLRRSSNKNGVYHYYKLVPNLTGHDLAGLYLITKHDGLPMLDLLQTKIPKLIHFSITTLGGTQYEPGVMRYSDLLDRIEDYIKQGLDPESVTIRIDPIIPGVTSFSDIEEVVRRASTMGIKRIRFSFMDGYPNTVQSMQSLGYDFEKYYGSNPASRSGFNFHAKAEYRDDITDFMLSLKDKYDITLGTCAEIGGREGISKEGCLSVSAVNNMLGTAIEDKGIDNNLQRALCSCYGGKVDALAYNSNCASHCVYCYAKHENDKTLEYYNQDGTLKDNAFTRTRREEQIAKKDKEAPQGNIQQPKVSYIITDTELSPRDARKFNSAHYFTPVAETSDATILEALKEDIEKSNLKIGARLLVDDKSTVDEIISAVRILKKAQSARIYEGSAIPVEAGRFTQEELEKLSKQGINNDGQNIYIPSFSVGLSERQLSDIDKRERVNNSKLFTPSQIRAIGLKSIWKVSDIVSKLQSDGINASREFLGNIETLKDKDFTGYNRLDIINEVGIGRLLDAARDVLFAPQGSDTPRELAKKQFIRENYNIIYEQAQDYLVLNEEASLTKNSVQKIATTQELGGTLAEVLNTDTEQEVAELLGSAAEHWMVGFRQVSAVSSLATIVRRNLSTLIDLDADGNAIQDTYGPKLIDVHQAVIDMLHWVSGAKDSDDMLDRLETHLATNPWLNQLVGSYHEDGDPSKPLKQGILIRPENSQLKSRFFTNFSKYFQPYIVMYKDDAGNTRLREINTKQFTDKALDDLRVADEHKDLGYLNIWKAEGGLSDAFYELSRIIGQKADVRGGFPATGMQAPREAVDKASLQSIQQALTILNIQSPSIEELGIVIKTVQDFNDIANRLWYIRKSIIDKANAYEKNHQNGFTLLGKDNSIRNNLSAILKKLEPVLHSNLEAVSYEAGKMHYGYVQPSYLNMHINDLKGNVSNYTEFLERNFKNYEGWFFNSGKHAGLAGEGWLNEWMEMLEQRQEYRDLLWHTASLAFEGTGYTDKISPQMGASLLFAYFYDTNKTSAYYRVILLSNKPSEEYIRFVRFTRGYDTHIIENIIKRTLPAEINRIRTVRERRKAVAEGNLNADNLVTNLETGDVNGEKFYFLKFLNDHIEQGTVLGQMVEEMINGTLTANPTDDRYVQFVSIFDREFRVFMNQRFEKFLDNLEQDGTITRENGDITSVYGVQDKVGTRTLARNNLTEFFWNDWYAQLNMQQILFGDPAQYSNAEDLQKRAAQFHSPGMRPDLAALDTKTKRPVSDGYERFMVLDDVIKPSSAVVILEKVHAKILSDPKFTKADGTLTELGKEKSKMLERIRNLFKEDNETDGQALISPTGLRKIMHLYGRWDNHMEEVYDKVISGDFTNEDLDVLWPVIKPFSYSVVAKDTHSSRMPFYSMSVQQKNSMFPIVLAGALARSVGVDSWLTALYDVMENSSRDGNTPKNDGIDAILFGSNLKTGLSGMTDISKMTPDMIRETLYRRMQPVQGQKDITGNQKKYNTDYVYEIPFNDWSQQQEVHNDFEGSQQKGSQQRVLTVADTANTSRDANGKVTDNFVNVQLLDGSLKKMTVKEAKKMYFEAHAANINRSAQLLAKELALDTRNTKLRNIALSNALVEELNKDGRFGYDMIRAVSVDRNGEFITPLSDPMLAGVIQQLLNSLIKNRIYKQRIAGGPLVQVSSFGLSKDLKIIYGRETGRPMYAEVMISAPNEWYEKDQNGEYIYKEFFDENGELSVARINAVNPKILEMIGYRIPTEAKYSMLPMKIVGFLPRSNGSIMLPKEITVLSGSDFDVDKLYIMRRVFNRIVDRKTGGVNYTTDVKNSEDRNNNIVLDIDWAFITSELNTDQVISAGQFDDLKTTGYMIAAADNQDLSKDLSEFVEENKDKDFKALKKDAYKASDLMFADTQIQFFKQNMIAAKLIGVFAQANVSHAFVSLLYDGSFVPTINIDESIKLRLLDRNGSEHIITGDVPIDNEWDWSGLKRISAVLAECIGASVDAVKDPIFNLMNINMATVNVFSTMIRFGWDTDSMAWFLTTPIIKELVKRYNRLNAEGSATIEQVISQLQAEIADQRPMIFDENHAWSKDDFIKMHRLEIVSTKRNDESDSDFITRKYETAHRNWQLLEVFRRMQAMADLTRSIVHITRSNSISAAPGPFAANTFVDDLKTEKFFGKKALDGVKGVVNNPVINAFMTTTSSLVRNILGTNLVQASPLAYSIYNGLENMFGYINDNLAQKMSEFMASYLTQWISPIFDLSYDNRRIMLLGFPNLFNTLKVRYPDNILLKSIVLKHDDAHNPYLELNTRGLQDDDISNLKAAWSTLYKEEEKRLAGANPFDYQNGNLALKLVEYNYFRGGFGFDSKTFTRLVPEDVKDKLGNYRTNTRALLRIDKDSIDIENLIYQFMLNYGLTNMPLQEGLDIRKRDDGTLYVTESVGNTNGFAYKGIVGVRQKNKTINYYIVNYDAEAGEFILTPVSKLGGRSFGFEIDPRSDVRNIKSVFDKSVQTQQGSVQTPEDSSADFAGPVLSSAEPSGTTKKLMSQLLGKDWSKRYTQGGKLDAVSAFRGMTDMFFDTWQSQAVDKITDNDNFVMEVLNEINFNLSKEETGKLIARAIERLDKENICH